MTDRHLDDEFATELDGGGDIRAAHLPGPQTLQHFDELVDALFTRAFHLQTSTHSFRDHELRIALLKEKCMSLLSFNLNNKQRIYLIV